MWHALAHGLAEQSGQVRVHGSTYPFVDWLDTVADFVFHVVILYTFIIHDVRETCDNDAEENLEVELGGKIENFGGRHSDDGER
jgi:hypothetical protein